MGSRQRRYQRIRGPMTSRRSCGQATMRKHFFEQNRRKQMKVLYTAEVTVTGGRSGMARSSDGAFEVKMSVPKEMGGSGDQGTNPEQLFAAGYAACLQSALMAAARRKH